MPAPTPKRLQRAAPARKAPTAATLPDAVEQLLQARAGGRCEFCAKALPRDRCRRHHRKLRSQGGLDDITNLVLVHFNCHNTIHANPMWSYDTGWLVRSVGNPARRPLTLHVGTELERRVHLVADGTYRAATPSGR